MPKYSFDCGSCSLNFSRSLKIGDYKSLPCPNCGADAARVFEGFGFNFAPGGSAPANSGVSKHDYPTADYAVGSDADKRWAEYAEREKVKNQVRKVTGTRNLVRTGTKDFVEYRAAEEDTMAKRRNLIRDVRQTK